MDRLLIYLHAHCCRQYHTTDFKPNNLLPNVMIYEMLELYDTKVSGTVLRGESGSNPADLLDLIIAYCQLRDIASYVRVNMQ